MRTDWTGEPLWKRLNLSGPPFSHLRWQPAFAYVVAILLVITGLAFFLTSQLSEIYTTNTLEQLAAKAQWTTDSVELTTAWAQGEPALTPLLKRWSTLLHGRATVIQPDGTALADSHINAHQIENLTDWTEIRTALASGQGRAERSEVLFNNHLAFIIAFAVPLPNHQTGVLRWAFPLDQLDVALQRMRSTIFSTTLLTSLLIGGLMTFQIERTRGKILHLTEMVARISQGDLNVRVLLLDSGEIGQLAQGFNRLTAKLQKQMSKRAREKDRLNTVLSAMSDGVLILNKYGKVRLFNPAAAQILQAQAISGPPRTFVQVVRDHRIVEVWHRCQQSGQEEIATVELDSDRFIRVVVTPLFKHGTPAKGSRGHLVIIQDLTRLHQLQTVRQDFISNISHELRTPLASMRALVDTLNDGALEDPPAAQRFLQRMDVEVDALNLMVQELFELSRIESGKVPLVIRSAAVLQSIAPAAERLRPQAERAHVFLNIDLPTNLPNLLVDADRIQQVLTNLVHNAIKFTPAGGSITITAYLDVKDDMVVISVKDTGDGVASEDLPRIFERFYKADRARTTGGTGLGLAIAKHIVQAHGGRIWVESNVGQGSTFFFSLPVAIEGFRKAQSSAA